MVQIGEKNTAVMNTSRMNYVSTAEEQKVEKEEWCRPWGENRKWALCVIQTVLTCINT